MTLIIALISIWNNTCPKRYNMVSTYSDGSGGYSFSIQVK
jgi:hypothetical protein